MHTCRLSPGREFFLPLCGHAAEVFVHTDMTANERIHLHVETGFDIRILAVWQRTNEQVHSDDLACIPIQIMHGRSGTSDFTPFPELMV